MHSDRPKPLHLICGRAIVMHVLHALDGLDLERTVVVVGADAERVTKKVHEQAPVWANVTFVEQAARHGSGDATLVGLSAFDSDDLDDTSTVIVLPGDRPLLRPDTVARLVERHESEGNAATVLTVLRSDVDGQRRIVRVDQRKNDHHILRIAEANEPVTQTGHTGPYECSTSIFAFRRDLLGPALRRLRPLGGPGIYALADVIETLSTMGYRIGSVEVNDESEVAAVDDRWQLAMAERELRARTNRDWLLRGVTMLDPRQTFIDVTVELGRDITLFPGTMLQGRTIVGDGCEIGPNTRLVDCVVGSGAVVQNTVGSEAEIGAGAQVGPFAFLEQGSSVGENARTGPFYTASAE
ncbi:MAG: putative bifunctional protein GlmU [Actinomycetota bacterium]